MTSLHNLKECIRPLYVYYVCVLVLANGLCRIPPLQIFLHFLLFVLKLIEGVKINYCTCHVPLFLTTACEKFMTFAVWLKLICHWSCRRSGGSMLGPGGTFPPNLAQAAKFLIGSIVISLYRCCLPNDEGPGSQIFFS